MGRTEGLQILDAARAEGADLTCDQHQETSARSPRVINEYVRQRVVLRREAAIRKMTPFPALRLSQKERAAIAKVMWADIVILDADAVWDPTFEDPKRYPAGIPSVMVNRACVIKDNEFTRNLPGLSPRRR